MSVSRLEAKGFFVSLFDFGFTSFITLRFLKLIYTILVALICLFGLIFLVIGLTQGAVAAVLSIIVVPLVVIVNLIFARIYMEIVALFFRIGENSRLIATAMTGTASGGAANRSGVSSPPPPPVQPTYGSAYPTEQQPPVRTAAHIELPRYMGPWHVIACVDNPVERKFVNPVETYALRPDGRSIDVTFHWHEGSAQAPQKEHKFKGTVTDPGTNARWRMKLFPFLAATYLIVDVGPNYEWAAVAHPSRKFGWILSRQSKLSEAQYKAILGILAQQGYDTSKFIKLPQQGGE